MKVPPPPQERRRPRRLLRETVRLTPSGAPWRCRKTAPVCVVVSKRRQKDYMRATIRQLAFFQKTSTIVRTLGSSLTQSRASFRAETLA